MITEAGKEYIAREFGVGDCWIYTGLSWVVYGIDGTTVSETGGTGKIVSRVISGATDRVVKNAKTYRKADLTSANEGNEVTLIDVRDVILVNDGYPAGEEQYCTGVPPTKGYLKVNTSPTGATVTVGATSCGTTPVLSCELSTGWKTVTITKTGYQPETRTVEITAGATSDLGTITLTPVTGDCELLIATWPGNADYWIDKATTEPPDGKTKSLMEGADHIWLPCGYHTVEYVLANYKYPSEYIKTKECKIGISCDFTCVLERLIVEDTGLLDVSAWKREAPTEEITNAIVRVGTEARSVPIGFTPLKDYAVEIGSLHVIVRAEDREDYGETVAIERNKTTTIKAIMNKAELKAIIRIGVGVAWMDDWSLGAYTFWPLGSYQDGWIRVETGIVETFQARICFIGGPVKVPAIYTEEKVLTPYMTASERHLDWDPWYVDPAYEGEYTVIAQLKMGVGSWPSPCPE